MKFEYPFDLIKHIQYNVNLRDVVNWTCYVSSDLYTKWLVENHTLKHGNHEFVAMFADSGYGTFRISFTEKNHFLKMAHELPFFDYLIKKYNTPNRVYHNWSHIEYILNTAWYKQIPLSQTQLLAILFHDIVYNVGDVDNEINSCSVMYDICSAMVKYQTLADAASIIEKTAFYGVDQVDLDDDTKVVLDLDLAALADQPFVYYRNTYQIMSESLNKYSMDEYREGRKKFLKRMLSREKIFYTDYFDEDIARSNLQTEYDNLLWKQ